mgnify:CR=1 FL=1
MLIKYSVDEVVERAAKHLSENSEITNFYPGSIARSLIEAIAITIGDTDEEEHDSLYRMLGEVLNQGYLSRASGEYLDLIGDLLSYKRRETLVLNEEGERVLEPIDDDTYRFEISQQVTVLMSSNETALRFALLLVDGVRDAIGHEFMYGTGSFLFTILEEEGEQNPELLSECKAAVQRVKALGVRGEVQFPEYVNVDLDVEIIFRESDDPVDKYRIRADIQASVVDYIKGLYLGESIIYNELLNRIMSVSDEIYDFQILKWEIAGEPVLLMNQAIDEEERFKVGIINII